MPNRYLRESLKESEAVNAIGFQAQVTWIHLILTVDDWGRCEASLKILRPKLFPLRLDQVREADLERWIAECERAGLVRLYQSEGKAYLQMMKWEVGRAEKSRFPAPSPDVLQDCYLKDTPGLSAPRGKSRRTTAYSGGQPGTEALDSDSDSDSDSGSPPTPSGGVGGGKAGKRKPKSPKPPVFQGELVEVFRAALDAYPGSKGDLQAEWGNFAKRWGGEAAEIVPRLLPAIQAEVVHKGELGAAGRMVPPFRRFRAWIDQRAWTETHPEVKPRISAGLQPDFVGTP